MLYNTNKIWLTIDVEELSDSNFRLIAKNELKLDYEALIDNWLNLCEEYGYKSTAFILGSFAEKYPHIVKKLSNNGHEIASHGLTHDLVYDIPFETWSNSISESKRILEDITGNEIKGYRSASWSLPFEKYYYEELVKSGYSYSSSYFPLKTYLYGNAIDKKNSFNVETKSGSIIEIPVPKFIVPFSGGFYLRTLPQFVQKLLVKQLISIDVKPVLYVHPYELIKKNSMLAYYYKYFKKNIDFFLAFWTLNRPISNIEKYLIDKK